VEADSVIGFAEPTYFALAIVVGLMLVAFVRLARWRLAARRDFAGPQADRWPASSYWPVALLVLGAAALVVIAAARPQWGDRDRLREREGVDLVLVLDISQSMEAADAAPTRLQVAQDELVQLVESQRGSRIGLVLFAGSAIMRSPLTTDTGAMTELLRRANQETNLARSGSDIGAALDQAANILASSDSPGKAVVVVSDGEDHVGSYVQKAGDLASKGVVILTAGVGTPQGAQLFDVDTRTGQRTPKRDASGQPVISRLNEASLQTIAGAGAGQYQRISGADNGLGRLQIDLSRLDPASFGAEESRLPIERFQLFAGAAIVLLLAAWFLPSRVRLPSPKLLRRLKPQPALSLALLALLVGACGGGDSLRERNAEANRMFAEGDFEGALTRYQDILAERPDVLEISFNAGNALHRLESFERAIAETQRALPPKEARLGAATYFALGNHFLMLERLEEAYVSYRSALLLDAGDEDAKHNLELTLLLLNGSEQQDGSQGNSNDEGEPQPGEEGQPGEAGTPQAGGTPGQPGSPSPGQPSGTPAAPNQNPERALAEALAGRDEELTFEEAIEILELLRQQQQQRPSGTQPGGAGPDY
jgi:Ca-activated chloride channel family protein